MLLAHANSILFYSILFYSILFYSILCYSILFYSILFYSILFYSILFYSTLLYSILFYSILFYSILFYSILFYSLRRLFIILFCITSVHLNNHNNHKKICLNVFCCYLNWAMLFEFHPPRDLKNIFHRGSGNSM